MFSLWVCVTVVKAEVVLGQVELGFCTGLHAFSYWASTPCTCARAPQVLDNGPTGPWAYTWWAQCVMGNGPHRVLGMYYMGPHMCLVMGLAWPTHMCLVMGLAWPLSMHCGGLAYA